MKQKLKDVLECINFFIAVALIFLILYLVVVNYMDKSVQHEYTLSPISDETYAVYYKVHSNVPANNYEVITFCVNEEMCTYTGEVHVSFVKDGFHATVKEYIHSTYRDEIWVYIPYSSLSYRENIHLGR